MPPRLPSGRTIRWIVAGLLLLSPVTAEAYIGPGAGFAFAGSFLVVFLTFLLALFALISWPFRYLWKLIRRKPGMKHRQVKRVVIVGLDGMEPTLADRYMAEGKMPHMKALAETGAYRRLTTTIPSISPVAWSSFSTGANPARHNIFDFLARDTRTYLPILSSAEVGPSPRTIKVGKYAIPLGKATFRLMRRSKAFWSVLGEHGVFSAVIRVPITFPPEKFHGVMLSAMGVPDLRGTQGTFSFYTSERGAGGETKTAEHTGGVRIPVTVEGNLVKSYVLGPENSMLAKPEEMKLPFEVRLFPERNEAELRIGHQRVRLQRRKFSPWVELGFKAAPGVTVKGIAHFWLKEVSPKFELYMSPVNIDPSDPALPISHPGYYATYLAKLLGRFSTLGLAEDTWALNEGVIDEQAFLEQTYMIDDEREAQLMNEIDKVRSGAVVCVFDAVDRVQHMMMRFLDPTHPAVRGADFERWKGSIEELYRRCDALIGRVRAKLGPDDLLLVMSDHGFRQFKRGVNLNSWLRKNGYLVLKEGRTTSGEWFHDVDWSRTRAYGLGLAGMYLNIRGRESQGIVEPGAEADALMAELKRKLTGLRDDETGAVAIEEMYAAKDVYKGPYVKDAPDFIIGYAEDYRVSWDGATGKVDDVVFEDNVKAWSADHCINPRRVPGVLFSSRPIPVERPDIMDIAPSVLEMFGVPAPKYMDGRSMWHAAQPAAAEPSAVPAGVTR